MNDIFSSNLGLTILMWSLGIILFVGLIILVILNLFKFYKTKNSKIFAAVSTLICLIGIWLILPFYTFPIAIMQFGHPSTIKILKLTDKISVLPAEKEAIYYELSRNYQVKYDGKNAIKYYEKAVNVTGKPNYIEQGLICPVYFWKGDRKRVQEVCHDDVIAVDYLRAKEYDNAIKTINKSIEKYEKENRSNGICNAYAIRAAVYKQKVDKSAYKKDYDKVMKTCPKSELYKEYIESENILDVYIGGKEKNRYEF